MRMLSRVTKSKNPVIMVRVAIAALALGQHVDELNACCAADGFGWKPSEKWGFSLFSASYLRLYDLSALLMALADSHAQTTISPTGQRPNACWYTRHTAKPWAGSAAANTLVPCCCLQSARWESNPRPASYKDAALTAELRASESRAGGNRTHTVRIKSPLCCLLHHDPVIGLAYAF